MKKIQKKVRNSFVVAMVARHHGGRHVNKAEKRRDQKERRFEVQAG
jgi:hypothetical protein